MMKKFLQKRLKNEKGLTLVELLAVIVILGIIAAIAVPAIGGIINNSKVGAMKSDVLNAISAAELYLVESPVNTEKTSITLNDLTGGEGSTNAAYLSDAGSLSAFEYNIADKTVTFTASTGSVTLSSTGSTKNEVNNFPNNSKDAVGNISITR